MKLLISKIIVYICHKLDLSIMVNMIITKSDRNKYFLTNHNSIKDVMVKPLFNDGIFDHNKFIDADNLV